MKSNKILIIGLGSIGKRHFENLKSLGYHDIALVSSKTEFPSEWSGFDVFPTLEEALNSYQFSHAFVCSPTAMHVGQLKLLINFKIPKIYLEKPISNNWNELDLISSLASKQGIEIVVGYDLHFDPGLNKVKELVGSGKLGKIYSANAFVGQYLPDWRPYEDHRQGMSASLKQGGGVMLDLIHEFDYLIWLLGKPQSVSAIYQMNPELEIETEDVADVLLKFASGATGTIHLDYHQPKLIRNCVITGSKGTVVWDLAERTVTHNREDKNTEIFNFGGFERNDRYVEIVSSFMAKREDERICTFEQGLESLQLVLAAKSSSETNTLIKFPSIK